MRKVMSDYLESKWKLMVFSIYSLYTNKQMILIHKIMRKIVHDIQKRDWCFATLAMVKIVRIEEIYLIVISLI